MNNNIVPLLCLPPQKNIMPEPPAPTPEGPELLDFTSVRQVPAVTPDEDGKASYFHLDDFTKVQLQAKVKPGCRLCSGTGVSGWRARGTMADVCKCVRQAAAAEASGG